MTEMSLELTHYLLSRYRRNQTVPVSTNQPPTYWKHQEGVKTDRAVAVLRSMWIAKRHLLSLSEPETTRIWCLLQLSLIQLHLISYVSTSAPDSRDIDFMTVLRDNHLCSASAGSQRYWNDSHKLYLCTTDLVCTSIP